MVKVLDGQGGRRTRFELLLCMGRALNYVGGFTLGFLLLLGLWPPSLPRIRYTHSSVAVTVRSLRSCCSSAASIFIVKWWGGGGGVHA